MIARVGQPLVAITAMLALGGAIALQIVRDRAYPRDEAMRTNLLYVRSGPALKRLALEYDALAADVYWIRAIQHYGGQRLEAQQGSRSRYDLLYPLLDITTTLDPYFKIAYRFGAIFLSEPPPSGPGRSDLAVSLLRKAVAAQPGNWQYYHDIAFVYYWHMRDYSAAAEWFRRAASQPEAPNWLAPVAASMLTQGNDRTSARFLWRQLLNADQPWLRANAERSLLQLDAMDVMDQLDQTVRQNPPPAGERYSWGWLVRRGVLRGIPLDTTRTTPYEIDPDTGRVTIARQSPLFPLPDASRNPKT
jgi:tetratricopeptide (TPR) repeat protein